MDASRCFVVSKMVAFFRVASVSMNKRTLVGVRAHARLLVVFIAVDVRVVIERAVSFPDRASSPLVFEMPKEACVRSMLGAFVLKE